jgi:hypothetical protein
MFATYGSEQLDPGQDSPVTGRLLLESASTLAQSRSLVGRPLAMYSSLMLPDCSRLRLLEPRPRFAAAFGEQRRPMSSLDECRAQQEDVSEECPHEMNASRRDDLAPFRHSRSNPRRVCAW